MKKSSRSCGAARRFELPPRFAPDSLPAMSSYFIFKDTHSLLRWMVILAAFWALLLVTGFPGRQTLSRLGVPS